MISYLEVCLSRACLAKQDQFLFYLKGWESTSFSHRAHGPDALGADHNAARVVRSPGAPPQNMRKLMPNWKYANTIADVLGEIRKNMASNANRRLNQPPEGANY